VQFHQQRFFPTPLPDPPAVFLVSGGADPAVLRPQNGTRGALYFIMKETNREITHNTQKNHNFATFSAMFLHVVVT
jgi:hypothetical protein